MKPHKRVYDYFFFYISQFCFCGILFNILSGGGCLLLFVAAVSCSSLPSLRNAAPKGASEKTLEQMKPPKSQPQRERERRSDYAHTVRSTYTSCAYEKYVTQDGAGAHNEIRNTHEICKKRKIIKK